MTKENINKYDLKHNQNSKKCKIFKWDTIFELLSSKASKTILLVNDGKEVVK